MKRFLYKISELIGYTILIEDTIHFETWETIKYTHMALYKYMGRWKHDNSIKMKRIWVFKIR